MQQANAISRSRRSLLTAAGAAVVGAAAATLATGHAVLAAGDDGKTIHVGDGFTDIQTTTYLANQANDYDLLALRMQGAGKCVTAVSVDGVALSGQSYGTANGVEGYSGSGNAVYGHSFGTGVMGRCANGSSSGVYGASMASKYDPDPAPIAGVGVFGVTNVPTGRGVYGAATSPTNENYGVLGTSHSPLGRAVFGWSQGAREGTGVWGQSDGAGGAGVRGYAWDGSGNSGKFGTGVLGTSGSHAFPPPHALSNTGVAGISKGGPGIYGNGRRGGLFAGTVSQVRLVPSTAASHPATGRAGDLFVDKTNHLWFCRGGSTWVKLA